MNRKISKRSFLKQSICFTAGMSAFCVPVRGSQSINKLSISEDLWKWSKLSMFSAQTPGGQKCMVCPNECILQPGDTSFCKNRINFRGKLYSIAYGNPCAVHVDPVEKKPFYHYLPGSRSFSIATAGCNFACLNCQNWSISQSSPRKTRNYDIMPPDVINQASVNKCQSVAYTYSEPVTFYEYVYDTAIIGRQHGIKSILVSNGYINEAPLRKLCSVIDAATIDLKSFDNDTYIRLNAGSLQPVLNSLKIFRELGVWLEISNLIIPQWSDNTEMIKKMCNWLFDNGFQDTPLHFLRFQPMYKLTRLAPTPVSVMQNAADIAKHAGLKYVYLGNVPGAEINTLCPKCKKTIVERKGHTVIANSIKKGMCGFCGQKIPGRWN